MCAIVLQVENSHFKGADYWRHGDQDGPTRRHRGTAKRNAPQADIEADRPYELRCALVILGSCLLNRNRWHRKSTRSITGIYRLDRMQHKHDPDGTTGETGVAFSNLQQRIKRLMN